MRHEEQRGEIGRGTFECADDVMHAGRNGCARDACGDVDYLLCGVGLDAEPQPYETRGDVFADAENICRADGMRSHRNHLDIEHRAGGGEGRARDVAAESCGRLREMGSGPEAQREHNDV